MDVTGASFSNVGGAVSLASRGHSISTRRIYYSHLGISGMMRFSAMTRLPLVLAVAPLAAQCPKSCRERCVASACGPRCCAYYAARKQDKRLAAASLMLGADRAALQSKPQGDIYEFGVYTGGEMRAWVDSWKNSSVSFYHLWVFDSFEGLPAVDMADEDPELRAKIASGGSYVRESASKAYGGRNVPGFWKQSDDTYTGPGGYNVAVRLGLGDFAQIEEHLLQAIGYGAHRTSLIKVSSTRAFQRCQPGRSSA